MEPHRIPVYLYELASDFHSYWNMGKENEEFFQDYIETLMLLGMPEK